MPHTKYLLALHRGLNLTLPRYHKLKDYFLSDWEACVKAPLAEWQNAGLDKRGIEKWFLNRKNIIPDQELEYIHTAQAHVLVYGTDDYPVALQHTPNPPVLLFVRGSVRDEDWPSLAVVGSRRVSQYGKRALSEILTPIAQSGLTIVSGLAYGVDTLAHQVALEQNARTIAVLGNGIDKIYPQANRALGEKIIAQGAIISEFLPGVVARPEYFPVRNRIIAGLSQAALVIEAAQKSGSLITADYTTDFGREVFAVPGEIFSKNAAGTNRLLSQGAHVALNGLDVLETLGIKSMSKTTHIELPTQGIEAEIIKKMPVQAEIHIDEIIRLSGFPSTTISANLMLMEIKGWIENLGGQNYVRKI